jgi:hypothetical protein
MPSRSYRRKLRASFVNGVNISATYISPPAFLSALTGQPTHKTDAYCESELSIIHRYFLDIIDTFIKFNDFTKLTQELNNITASLSSKVEFYRIIALIENQLLSVTENIINGDSIGIITLRLSCVKQFVDQLPSDCAAFGPVTNMILEILDLVITNVSFDKVRANIIDLQAYMTQKYGDMANILHIHSTFLDIITNITEGTSSGIIGSRLEYVKMLVSYLKNAV